jgi:hypothetical protein
MGSKRDAGGGDCETPRPSTALDRHLVLIETRPAQGNNSDSGQYQGKSPTLSAVGLAK